MRPRTRPRYPLASLSLLALLILIALPGCDPANRSSSLLESATDASAKEIVFYTAREIVTLNPNRPTVEAIAIAGDRIVATGPLEEVTRGLAGRAFRVDRQFDDSVLIPGLINQHEHAWLAAIAMIAEIISIEDWELPGRQALRAGTIDAAYSLQLENEVGSIEPGKVANLTVLAENPLTVAPEAIEDVRVEGTVHEGRVLPVRSNSSRR